MKVGTAIRDTTRLAWGGTGVQISGSLFLLTVHPTPVCILGSAFLGQQPLIFTIILFSSNSFPRDC